MIELEPAATAPTVLDAPFTYRQALHETRKTRRHLLLGNGFSMAYDRNLFSYENLAAAGGEPDQTVRDLLSEKAGDIEAAIIVLLQRRGFAVDEGELEKAEALALQIGELKEHLIRAVTAVHPGSAFDVEVDRKAQCCNFLKPYIGRSAIPHGIVFTTNYDLLLYWTLVAHAIFRSRGDVLCWDGFKGEDWVPKVMQHVNMSAVYLHGALHLHNHGNGIKRIMYQMGAVNLNLITQIRMRLDQNEFPIFVAEGDSSTKLRRISGNPYLSAAFDKFKFACKEGDSALFVIGHRLAKQDEHLSDQIGKGRIGTVYFGAYGGAGSEDARNAEKLAARWAGQRADTPWKAPLTVKVFDSRECEIWHPQGKEMLALGGMSEALNTCGAHL